MNRPASYEELTRLIARLLDDGLSPAERDRLGQLLEADPDARLLYMQYIDMQVELACLVPAAAGEPAPRALDPFRRRLRWIAPVAAAVAVAVLATWLAWPGKRPEPAATAARLTDLRGTVQVESPDGPQRRALPDAAFLPGQLVRAQGEDSSAVIAFADSTRLVLLGDTSVLLMATDPKRVEVREGILAASVATQRPGQPMLVTTPRAEVQVLGTEFALAATGERTDLSVSAGRVKLVRKPDGAAVEVTPGKYVLAGAGSELVVRDVATALDRWEVDFEAGLPEGWQQGEWSRDGLPAGSRGAVRTAARPEPGSGKPWHGIATSKGWVTGLFAVHDDSWLNFTFKMDRPGWAQVLLVTRGPDLKSPAVTVYSVSPRTLGAEPGWWAVPAGTWQTARIPLKKFKRLPDIGPSPPATAVPFQIVFSSQDRDRGLTIDRIWVSRGQPADK